MRPSLGHLAATALSAVAARTETLRVTVFPERTNKARHLQKQSPTSSAKGASVRAMLQPIKKSIQTMKSSSPLGRHRRAERQSVHHQSANRRSRGLLAAGAGVVALACLALALTLASCGSGAKHPSSTSKSAATQSTASSATATQAAETNESVTILPRGAAARQIVATVESQPISAAEVRSEMLLKSGAPVRLGMKCHRGSSIVMPEQQRYTRAISGAAE